MLDQEHPVLTFCLGNLLHLKTKYIVNYNKMLKGTLFTTKKKLMTKEFLVKSIKILNLLMPYCFHISKTVLNIKIFN